MDYQLQPITRTCSITGRALKPGERFFAALFDQKPGFVRKDFAADAWPGPPEGAIAFWAGKVPAEDEKKRLRIDDELLLDCFARLEDRQEPAEVNFRYVVALLLMRRKRLRFEEARVEDAIEVLSLNDIRGGSVHRVINPRLTEEAMLQVQEEVFKVLGWE
jgi:hypothetical protein